jgi:hypothetical protein
MSESQFKKPGTAPVRKRKQGARSHSRFVGKSADEVARPRGTNDTIAQEVSKIVEQYCIPGEEALEVRLSKMIAQNDYSKWNSKAGDWSRQTWYKCVCGRNFAGAHKGKNCTPRDQVIAYYIKISGETDLDAICLSVEDKNRLVEDDFNTPSEEYFEMNLTNESVRRDRESENVYININKFKELEDECAKNVKTIMKDSDLQDKCCGYVEPKPRCIEETTKPVCGCTQFSRYETATKLLLDTVSKLDKTAFKRGRNDIGYSRNYDEMSSFEKMWSSSVKREVSLKAPPSTPNGEVDEDEIDDFIPAIGKIVPEKLSDKVTYKPSLLKRIFTKKSTFDFDEKFNHKSGQIKAKKDQHVAGIEVIPDAIIMPDLYAYLRRHEFETYKVRADKLAHMTKLAVKFDCKLEGPRDLNSYFATIQKVCDSTDTQLMLTEVNPNHSRSRFSAWWAKFRSGSHFA